MNTTIETTSPAVETSLPNSTPQPAPVPSTPRGNRVEERLSDKIARLPKAARDMINAMLEDGLPYRVLIDELGEAGQGLTAQHLADWVQGRYQDYLKDRQTMDHAKARMEFASDLLRELGDAD